MKRILLIGIIYSCTFIFAENSFSQKLVSKISKEICNCLENYGNMQTQMEIEAAMESCIMKSSMKNLEAIKKEMGIDMTQGETAGRQFGEVIAYELIKKCDVFLKYIMMVSTDNVNPADSSGTYEESSVLNPDLVPYEKFSTDTMTASIKDCMALRNAKFVYVTDNPDKMDYFILAGKSCTEYHENGKYISHYKIKWKNECEYISTFVDSTNPEINNLLAKGDKINYQILGVYANTVYINLDYKGFSKTFKMSIQQ
jgi:hypothetical protein